MKNLEILKDLVSIKSFDTNSNEEIINYLINKFEPYAEEIKIINNCKLNKKKNLLIGLNTKIENINDAIVLSGHMDTVVADEYLYKTNPYIPTLIDDKLYGLGTIDMKSYFAIILNNIEELKKIKKPIIIAITSDEETDFEGVENISSYLKEKNVTPYFTIVGEPTNMKICTSSKCCYEYQIDITGLGCHSSKPQNGINANYIAAKFISFIEKLSYKYPNTTLNCGIMQGGDKVNIVSPNSKIVFDLRTDNKSLIEKVLKDIRNKIAYLKKKYNGCSIELSNNLSILPLEKRNSLIIEKLLKEFNLEENEFTGGCEAGYFQALGGDSILFGVGDLALAHKPNEFVNVNEFKKYNDMFVSFVKSL